MTPCKRKCHDCGNVADHKDNITPHVLCKKCGSQDTRLVKPSPTQIVTAKDVLQWAELFRSLGKVELLKLCTTLNQAVELLREKCTTGFEIDGDDSFCPRCEKIKAFLTAFDEVAGGTGE